MTTAIDIETTLRALVARIAKVAPDSFGVDDDVRVAAGMDSLTILRLAAAIEREFNVVIPDDKLPQLLTLRSIITLLTQQVQTRRDEENEGRAKAGSSGRS